MRNSFIAALLREARANERVILVTGDLGFGVLEPFAEELPNQFLNAGVAEQNMMSMAAGIASQGFKVFVYSIGNFPTLRCLEQIRNDVCYHNHDVTIVSVGAGFSYGTLGYSHHAIEDIAALRCLPNLDVICPADPTETEVLTDLIMRRQGPHYLRLGKARDQAVHQNRPVLRRGQAIQLKHGEDVSIAATGSVVHHGLAAAEVLQDAYGVNASVWSVPFITPLDQDALGSWGSTAGLVTVEEHVISGGFGSACWEAMVSSTLHPFPIRPVHASNNSPSKVGSADYLQSESGLTVDSVVARSLEILDSL